MIIGVNARYIIVEIYHIIRFRHSIVVNVL